MIGVAALPPFSGTVHLTFSDLLNVAGSPVSVVLPLNSGPRHCGQFSARAMLDVRIESSKKYLIIEWFLALDEYKVSLFNYSGAPWRVDF